jgi:UDP-N-acetylglucosamine 2-epimerase (non-hydrolysing)
MLDAYAVVTDSGGIQEETTVLGVPCFTLRENTERPITIERGTNTLLGVGDHALERLVGAINGSHKRQPFEPEGWDGLAAERVRHAITSWSLG